MEIEIVKITPSLKFANKYFLDARVNNLFVIKGMVVHIMKKGPYVSFPHFFTENKVKYSPFVFATLDLTNEFREKIKEGFLHAQSNGTIRPHDQSENTPLGKMDRPPSERALVLKKRLSDERRKEGKKDNKPKPTKPVQMTGWADIKDLKGKFKIRGPG